MEVGLGAGRILLLMAGLVWIFRVAVGKRPTAGNADGMHASSIKRATESPSHLHLDRGGRNNSLRVNDSRSATISRGSAPLLGDCPARIPGAGRHRRRRRRRQVLPIKEEQTATGSSPTLPGTQGSSKQAAMRPRRLLLLLSPLHRTLASSCRAPAPASVGWVGQLTLHAGRDRDMAPSIQKGRRKTSSTQSPAFPPPALAYMLLLLLLLRAAAAACCCASERRRGGDAPLKQGHDREKGPWQGEEPSSSTTRDHWGGKPLVDAGKSVVDAPQGRGRKTESQPPVAFHESAGPRPARAT